MSEVRMTAIVVTSEVDGNGNQFSPEALQQMERLLNERPYPIVSAAGSDRKIGESGSASVVGVGLRMEGTIEPSYLGDYYLSPCVKVLEFVDEEARHTIKSCEPIYFFPCTDHADKGATHMKVGEEASLRSIVVALAATMEAHQGQRVGYRTECFCPICEWVEDNHVLAVLDAENKRGE